MTRPSAFNLTLEAIVAGIDPNGARIAQITHPGIVAWMDKLGYAAIGSGGIQAATCLYLSAQTRHRSLHETLYSVYEAKRASERAPGVGKETNVAIIESGQVQACSAEVLEALESVHRETTKRQAPSFDVLRSAMGQRSEKR